MTGQVHVAVVGMGDIGRGWAALCVACGWPVSIYDHEAHSLQDAVQEVSDRARTLTSVGLASVTEVDQGIGSLKVAGSLLQACRDASWVIEAVREDLLAKQKVFEGIESVAGNVRVITSSSSGFAIKDVAGRCLRQERCITAHPLNPVELIPLVEVAPGPHADGALVELLKGWLRALGRIPVVINKQVPGNVANRIAAAVWRECIDLVLNGVVDVQDLDRAVSLGPALGWAAAGPHLTYHLAAGPRGVEGFLQSLLHHFENTWQDLATWPRLESDQQNKLVQSIKRAYRDDIDRIRPARDRRLAGILRSMRGTRPTLDTVVRAARQGPEES